ncbi:MAG: hypothetical protein RSA86_05385 [Christensenellaceae bacterium]
MTVFIISLVALACSLLTFLPTFGYLSILGFVLGITSWVVARKLHKSNRADKLATSAMVIGIIATFTGLVGILFSFIIGGLLIGGFSEFLFGKHINY